MKFLSIMWVQCKAMILNIVLGVIGSMFIEEVYAITVIGLGSFVLMLSVFATPVLWMILVAIENAPYSREALLTWFAFIIFLEMMACTFVVATATWTLSYIFSALPLCPCIWLAVKSSRNALLEPRTVNMQGGLN